MNVRQRMIRELLCASLFEHDLNLGRKYLHTKLNIMGYPSTEDLYKVPVLYRR
jgi:hypothetical protein